MSRSFLGLTGYHKRFIPNFASIAAPLTSPTRKSVLESVSCGVEGCWSFSKLKDILLSFAVVRSPDLDIAYILQTDASAVGVGAILGQQDADRFNYPVTFFSRKLLPCEHRFSIVEKEHFSIKIGIKAFHVYLLGRSSWYTLIIKHCSG